MARLIDRIENQERAWAGVERARARDHMPHAMAVCGAGAVPPQFAWAMAQAMVCEREAAPCGECGACLRVEHGQSESVLFIEPEKGVIKLEAAGQISHFLSLQKLTKVRVILIQDAHLLNPQAGNAILKMVEEPPPSSHFLFVTPEAGQLLPTLRSRVQVIRLGALRPDHSADGLRPRVAGFLKACLGGEAGAVRVLLDEIEGREESEHAARVLQQILRDWTAGELPGWPEWDVAAKVELWRRARQMEHDLHGNVDRALVFENFYHGVNSAVD